MPHKILIVDDTLHVQMLLTDCLSAQGYEICTASNGVEGLQKLTHFKADLILLDIMMAQMNGYEFITELRKTKNIPVIMITAKQSESDVIKGFELGADDYITKPFKMNELVMRLKAVLKRSTGGFTNSSQLEIGNLLINTTNNEVKISNTVIDFTPAEFSLLLILSQSIGHTITKAVLCMHLIDEGYSGSESTLKIHIRNIRTKLDLNKDNKIKMESIFGVGYRLLRTD